MSRPPSARAHTALILVLLAVPAGLLPFLGALLAVATVVLGIRARRQRPGVAAGALAVAMFVVHLDRVQGERGALGDAPHVGAA